MKLRQAELKAQLNTKAV